VDAPRLTAITDFSNMNAGGQYLRQVVTSPSRFTIDSENADAFSPAVRLWERLDWQEATKQG